MMAGAVARLTVVGIVGFVVMLVSATIALAALRGTSGGARAAEPPRPSDRLDARPVRHPVASPPRRTSPEHDDRRERRGAAERRNGLLREPTTGELDSTTPGRRSAHVVDDSARGHGLRLPVALSAARRPGGRPPNSERGSQLRPPQRRPRAAVLERGDTGQHVLGQRAGYVRRRRARSAPARASARSGRGRPPPRVPVRARAAGVPAATRRARGRTRRPGGGPSRAATGRSASPPRGRRRCRAARPRRPRRRLRGGGCAATRRTTPGHAARARSASDQATSAAEQGQPRHVGARGRAVVEVVWTVRLLRSTRWRSARRSD